MSELSADEPNTRSARHLSAGRNWPLTSSAHAASSPSASSALAGGGANNGVHQDPREDGAFDDDAGPAWPPTSYERLRPDLRAISDMIRPAAKVLDLGCGDGELLDYLVHRKDVHGRGIELSEAGVLACVGRGLSVRQGMLQEGLADYPAQSMDYVVLSQTLPFLSDPTMIVQEMLRVGRWAILSFTNWGHWRCRLNLLFTGRIPLAKDLPRPWYSVPRWQAFTITDFRHFCDQIDVRISDEIYLADRRRVRISRYKNLLATTAIFALERKPA